MNHPPPPCGAAIESLLRLLFPGSTVATGEAIDPDGWIFRVERHDGTKAVTLVSSPTIDRLDATELTLRAAAKITQILGRSKSRNVKIFAPRPGELQVEEVT